MGVVSAATAGRKDLWTGTEIWGGMCERERQIATRADLERDNSNKPERHSTSGESKSDERSRVRVHDATTLAFTPYVAR